MNSEEGGESREVRGGTGVEKRRRERGEGRDGKGGIDFALSLQECLRAGAQSAKYR